ncbi:MAG: hypothetical protein ACI9BD_000926 [Candidatus Marinamargulisbacteria bacterium]|jgi:hypothetical protein
MNRSGQLSFHPKFPGKEQRVAEREGKSLGGRKQLLESRKEEQNAFVANVTGHRMPDNPIARHPEFEIRKVEVLPGRHVHFAKGTKLG